MRSCHPAERACLTVSCCLALQEYFLLALSQPRMDREVDDPLKEKPSGLAGLRTKSFAATGKLVGGVGGQRTSCQRCAAVPLAGCFIPLQFAAACLFTTHAGAYAQLGSPLL